MDDPATHCPICDAERTREYTRKQAYGDRWIIRRCRQCGHGFVSNRPTLERLREIYAASPHEKEIPLTIESLATQKDCAAVATRVAAMASGRARSLDVGSGQGGFSFHLAKEGFERPLLIDLDPHAATGAALVPRGEFRQCAFEDLRDDDGPFDAIVMSHILEHALDPIDWLRRARRLLKPQGVLAVAMPNFGGVYRLLGSRNPMLIPPIHLNHFTARSLRRALRDCGFKVEAMHSTSRVRIRSQARRLSPARVLAGHLWNSAATVLDRTTLGISLRAFARPAPPLARAST